MAEGQSRERRKLKKERWRWAHWNDTPASHCCYWLWYYSRMISSSLILLCLDFVSAYECIFAASLCQVNAVKEVP